MTEELNPASDTVVRAPVRIAVADDRRLVADALAALIRTMDGFELVAVFDGAAELPAIVARDPGVLLVATGADPTGGFNLVRALREIGLRVEIVLLADVLSPQLVRFTLDQRLSGLILTDTSASGLAACLGRVASGHAVLPADWQAVLATQGHDPVGSLSDRQLEVLRLVAEGYSYEEIGRRLFISANTVKFHLRAIYMRLGVRNRVAAARMLSERGSPEGNPAHKVGPGPRPEIRPAEDEPPRSE